MFLSSIAKTMIVLIGAAATAVVSPEVAQSPPKASVRAIAVVLRPHGFEPADIQAAAGKTLLAVYNRSGAEVILRVEREADSAQAVKRVLREERVPLGKRAARAVFDLVAGSYVVTEVAHPAWKCRITVTPH